MVRRAFEAISDVPTRLVCFSDDLDGLRKVPGNVPGQDALREDLGLPLSRVRDPWGCHDGFAQHNNAMLRAFLDGFGFDYEFVSATEAYGSGRFDETLRTALERFDAIMEIMLPTLGPERRATYSPFLPVSPRSGSRPAGADAGARRGARHHPLRGARRGAGGGPRHGGPLQDAVEGRLGAALGRARRGLRDVGQGLDGVGRPVLADLRGARREAARDAELRALPRRGGAEDLQVQGQRALDRGVAALRPAGVVELLHVPQAPHGQTAAPRRAPQGRGRIPPAAARVSGAGGRAAPRQPRLARPRGRAAGVAARRALRDAAEPRRGGGGAGRGDALGLHPPLRARRRAGHAPRPRSRRAGRRALLRRRP